MKLNKSLRYFDTLTQLHSTFCTCLYCLLIVPFPQQLLLDLCLSRSIEVKHMYTAQPQQLSRTILKEHLEHAILKVVQLRGSDLHKHHPLKSCQYGKDYPCGC